MILYSEDVKENELVGPDIDAWKDMQEQGQKWETFLAYMKNNGRIGSPTQAVKQENDKEQAISDIEIVSTQSADSVSKNLQDDDGWKELNKDENYSIMQKDNSYRLITAPGQEPTEEQMREFIKALPAAANIRFNEGVSPKFKAIMIAALGKEGKSRIVDIDKIEPELRKDPEIAKILDTKANDDNINGDGVHTGVSQEGEESQQEGEEAIEDDNQSKLNSGDRPGNSFNKLEEAQAKPVKEYKDYDRFFLSKEDRNVYDDWKKLEKGSFNDFLNSDAGAKYKDIVDVNQNKKLHNRWQTLWSARKEYKKNKKDYKSTEGFVQDLQFLGAVDTGLPRDLLKNKDKLKNRIDELEQAQPEMFGKYRKMFEGEYYASLSNDEKKDYRDQTYEDRTKKIKEYMQKSLIGEDGKGGYLNGEAKDKPTWRKEYQKIRKDEEISRKAKRKIKWIKRGKNIRKAGKATLMFAGKVAKWPFKMAERTLVACWKSAQYVYNSITSIPNKVRENRESRREKKMDKLIDKYNNNEKDRTAKQILRLQGRINAGKGGKIVGLADRWKIRKEVNKSTESFNIDKVGDIINKGAER